MSKFVEIGPEEIGQYKDSVSLFGEGAIAYAQGKERANGLTIAWGGLGVLWRKPCMTVYIHKDRYSKTIFDEADAYSVNFFGDEAKELLNYFGSHSGRNEDKAAVAQASIAKGDIAPYFEDAELVVLCKKMGQNDFDPNSVDEGVKAWYAKSGVHTIYHGEIVKVLRKMK